MSDFLAFCRAHGILIESLPPVGVWRRYPTQDHPRKRNGAVKYLGTHGFCQNHATMTEVELWKGQEAESKIDHEAIARAHRREQERLIQARRAAAARAKEIVSAARLEAHPYLDAKGFEGRHGLVWTKDDVRLLVVPMFLGKEIVGCQLIGEDGGKKFLTGQQTKGVVHAIGNGRPVWCEGYVTGLSVQSALSLARMRCQVVVCFSAHNLQHLARDGYVVADNDASGTGEKVARATGLPYWMSPVVGQDFNDYWREAGGFRASQELKRALMRRPEAVAMPP